MKLHLQSDAEAYSKYVEFAHVFLLVSYASSLYAPNDRLMKSEMTLTEIFSKHDDSVYKKLLIKEDELKSLQSKHEQLSKVYFLPKF